MENHVENKRTSGQLTFRTDPKKREAIEKAASEKGMTVAEYLRELVEEKISPAISQSKKEESRPSERESEITNYLLDLLEKTNETNELISKMVQSQEPEATETLPEEVDIRQVESAAIANHEEKIRSEFLMLNIDQRQRDLLLNLLAYRQERGKVHSESVEDLFFFMFKETFYESWNHKQPGFDDEFKEAFSSYFQDSDEV